MTPEEYAFLVFDKRSNPSYEVGTSRTLKVMNPDENIETVDAPELISSASSSPTSSPTPSPITPDSLRPYCEAGNAPISSSLYHKSVTDVSPTPPPSPEISQQFNMADGTRPRASAPRLYEDPDAYLIGYPFAQSTTTHSGIVRPAVIQRPFGPVQETVDDLITLINTLHKTFASNFHAAYRRCEHYVYNSLEDIRSTSPINLNIERAQKAVRQAMLRKVTDQLDIVGYVLGTSHRVQEKVKPYHPLDKNITRARLAEESRARTLHEIHSETEDRIGVMAEYSLLSRKLTKQIKNLAGVMRTQNYDSWSPAFDSFSHLERALQFTKPPRMAACERTKLTILERKFRAIDSYQLAIPDMGKKDRTIYLYEVNSLRKVFVELSMRISELSMLEQFAEAYNSISFIVESALFDKAYPVGSLREIIRHRQYLMRRLRFITDACTREKERHTKLVKEFDRQTPLVGLKPFIPSEQAQEYLHQARHLTRAFEHNHANLIFQ